MAPEWLLKRSGVGRESKGRCGSKRFDKLVPIERARSGMGGDKGGRDVGASLPASLGGVAASLPASLGEINLFISIFSLRFFPKIVGMS